MKKWAGLLAGVAVAIAVWFLLSTHKTGSAPSAQKSVESQNAAVARALANQNTNTVAVIGSNFARARPRQVNSGAAVSIVIPPAGPPSPLQFTNIDPATVLQNVSRAIRQYGAMFGGNPVGNNQEITSELSGKNPKHVDFISADAGMTINGNGEMVDPWGTPYFFHQISGADTEIHSAGPDRIMWTSDDIVVHATQ